MNRLLSYLLGPELLWLVLFVASDMIAQRNIPPTPAGTGFLERAAIVLPAIGVPLTFGAFATPGVHRWVMATRVVLAIAIGLNLSLFALIGRIDYGDSRNSGTLGFWVIGVLAGMVAFVVAAGATFFILRARTSGGAHP